MNRIFFLSALKGPVAPMAEVILRQVTAEHEITGFLRVKSQPWHRRPGVFRRLTPLKILRRLERDFIYSRWFGRRDQRIKQLLAAEAAKPFNWPATSEILSTELNSPRTAERLRELRPDVLIVFGCPLLKPEIFSVPKIATVNVHLGIAPWYRGEHTVFFPLLFEDYERIGFTLHRIDRGVDTGAVLAQGFPALSPDDDEASIMAKIATMAGDLLTEYLHHAEAPGMSQQVFGTKGRVFKGGGRHFWHDLKWSWRRRSGGGRCTALRERRQTYFTSPTTATEPPRPNHCCACPEPPSR